MSRSYLIDLDGLGTLRVRMPEENTRGSMLLMIKGTHAVFDCCSCSQYIAKRYTEAGWVDRYDQLYGFYDRSIKKKMIRANDDPESFKFQIPNSGMGRLINADSCLLSKCRIERPKYASWDHAKQELEIQVVSRFASDHDTIAHTEYASLLLRFEKVL